MKRTPTKLARSLLKKKNIWTDSETDTSSTDDSKITSVTTKHKNNKSIQTHCCLICSISSSLSHVNCCSKHLTSLTTTPMRPLVYVMRSGSGGGQWHEGKSHCRLKRHRHSSSSASSPSSSSVLSPRETHRRSHKNKNDNNNNSCQLHTPLSTPIINRPKINTTRSSIQNSAIEPNTRKLNDDTTSADAMDTNSDLAYPRIQLQRIIHVKDEQEESNENSDQIVLSMAEMADEIFHQTTDVPKIFLKRVCYEQY